MRAAGTTARATIDLSVALDRVICTADPREAAVRRAHDPRRAPRGHGAPPAPTSDPAAGTPRARPRAPLRPGSRQWAGRAAASTTVGAGFALV
jgi:hypothetical protein